VQKSQRVHRQKLQKINQKKSQKQNRNVLPKSYEKHIMELNLRLRWMQLSKKRLKVDMELPRKTTVGMRLARNLAISRLKIMRHIYKNVLIQSKKRRKANKKRSQKANSQKNKKRSQKHNNQRQHEKVRNVFVLLFKMRPRNKQLMR